MNIDRVINNIKNDRSGWIDAFIANCKIYHKEHYKTIVARKKEATRINNDNILNLVDKIDKKQTLETSYLEQSMYSDDYDNLFVTALGEVNDDSSIEIITYRTRSEARKGHKNLLNYIKKYGLYNIKGKAGYEYCWIYDDTLPKLIGEGNKK
jgi:hypothetical protein